MANIEIINKLGAQIEIKWVEIGKISFEINNNLFKDDGYIFSKDYKNLFDKKEKLKEELSVIKAERNIYFHEYSFTLYGNYINDDGVCLPNNYWTSSILSVIDCEITETRKLDAEITSHRALLALLEEKFKSCFLKGEFLVHAIFKHR